MSLWPDKETERTLSQRGYSGVGVVLPRGSGAIWACQQTLERHAIVKNRNCANWGISSAKVLCFEPDVFQVKMSFSGARISSIRRVLKPLRAQSYFNFHVCCCLHVCVVKRVWGGVALLYRGIEGWVRSQVKPSDLFQAETPSHPPSLPLFLSFTFTHRFWTQTVCSVSSLTRRNCSLPAIAREAVQSVGCWDHNNTSAWTKRVQDGDSFPFQCL